MHFYPLLCKKQADEIARWTKDVDIFSFDFIVIPVHLHTEHWMAVIIVKPAWVIGPISDENQ